MVSTKERARLAREFQNAADAMERQKEAITRLTLMITEGMAALYEIAHMGDGHLTTGQMSLSPAIYRAQAALDRMEVIRSSGNDDDGEESKGDEPEATVSQGDGTTKED